MDTRNAPDAPDSPRALPTRRPMPARTQMEPVRLLPKGRHRDRSKRKFIFWSLMPSQQ